MDLMSLLPLLTGNADTAQILQTVLGGCHNEKPKPPEPTLCRPTTACNYAKLYPDYQHVADLPRCDEPPKKQPKPQPDLTQLLSLFTAMQQSRLRHEPQTCPLPAVECVAPRDIKKSLQALLDLNALSSTP